MDLCLRLWTEIKMRLTKSYKKQIPNPENKAFNISDGVSFKVQHYTEQ